MVVRIMRIDDCELDEDIIRYLMIREIMRPLQKRVDEYAVFEEDWGQLLQTDI